ncbi:hypothetical protein Pcinc_015412 [Petrolisthes cinctipes]|uniref:SWIM-type domain-containing protein n=1 Tax=Petrolisthes cinctipes TaxID=88211 RepID=A0AAE1KQH4_PETCI|nr:hypothetical protein Pcinc_015412 [Petrolisthes cinctipes]
METGFCECNVWENGSLCKHQAACMTVSPQVFTATNENRWWLASVAVGDDKTPPESFFMGLLEPQLRVEEENLCAAAAPECQTYSQNQAMLDCPSTAPECEAQNQPILEEAETSEDYRADISEFVTAIQTVNGKYGNAETEAALKTAVKRL